MKMAGAGMTFCVAGCTGDDSPDGERVSLEITVRSSEAHPINNEQARLIRDGWEELGVDVELDTMSHQSFVEYVFAFDHEVGVVGWGGSTDRLDPSHHVYLTQHSEQSYNLSQYDNPEYDELAEETLTTVDRDERQDLVYQAQEMLAEDQPTTPLHQRVLLEPYNTETVTNLEPAVGQGLASYHNMVNCETESGVFRWGGRGTVSNLNPINLPAVTDRQMIRLLHERPAQIGPSGDVRPRLCETIEAVDDTTIRLALRDEDLSFHDGEPITAEDLQFSYEFQSEHHVPFSQYLESLENAEVVDDRTVDLHLSEPDAPFLTLGVAFPFVLPKHRWEDVDNPLEYEVEEPVGSGPFQFEYWRSEEEMSVSRFEDHFDPPNVEEVIRVMGPLQSLVRLLEDGGLDAVWGSGLSISLSESATDSEHVELVQPPTHGIDLITYQTQVEPFDQRAVRRALANATPKQEIHESVMQGYGEVIHTQIAPANEFWHNPDVEEFGDDMEAARAELEEAGYEWDDDGNLYYPAAE